MPLGVVSSFSPTASREELSDLRTGWEQEGLALCREGTVSGCSVTASANTSSAWIRAPSCRYSLLDQYAQGKSKPFPRNTLNYQGMSVSSLLSNSNQGTLNYTVITVQWMDNDLGSFVSLQEKYMVISVFAVL